MALYVYAEQQIEGMVRRGGRLRIRFGIAAFVILSATFSLAFYRPVTPRAFLPAMLAAAGLWLALRG